MNDLLYEVSGSVGNVEKIDHEQATHVLYLRKIWRLADLDAIFSQGRCEILHGKDVALVLCLVFGILHNIGSPHLAVLQGIIHDIGDELLRGYRNQSHTEKNI